MGAGGEMNLLSEVSLGSLLYRVGIGCRMGLVLTLVGVLFGSSAGRAEEETKAAVTTEIGTGELANFSENPEGIQKLLTSALELTGRELKYQFGSADPSKGGMDCSGTIYFTLKKAGWKEVPRTASGQYVWARKAGTFEAVVSTSTDSFELDELKPGDLLFWSGTYATDRDPPVSHSMVYLGRAKSDGKMLMFGASDGRSYRGERQSGVSVFDFRIPQSGKTRFVGYARIPGEPEKAATTESSDSGTDDSAAE